jgi:hypothetical protein
MYFGTKSYLKSTRNHTVKHALIGWRAPFYKRIFFTAFPCPWLCLWRWSWLCRFLTNILWLIVVVLICVVVLDLYMFCASLPLKNLGCVLFYCHAKDFFVNLFHLCFLYSVVCCFLCSYASLASFFPFLCACFLNFKLLCPFFFVPLSLFVVYLPPVHYIILFLFSFCCFFSLLLCLSA